jgi:carbonic anhydrase/acetyltransferase-like protein (isoleucine patch superfamily)
MHDVLIRGYRGQKPQIHSQAVLLPRVTVIGDVQIKEQANLWYGAVVRGDVGNVVIEARANIQDLACIHMTKHVSNTWIGEDVSIGHHALVHGARIDPGVLIGMGAIIMDNAHIGEGSLIGAGTLITAHTKIPPRSLVVGSPGKIVRKLSPDEAMAGKKTAERYLGLAQEHQELDHC